MKQYDEEEIKGSDISETTKKDVYKHILEHGSEKLELGLILLDNEYTTDKFIENHARSFNYMIQTYLENYSSVLASSATGASSTGASATGAASTVAFSSITLTGTSTNTSLWKWMVAE